MKKILFTLVCLLGMSVAANAASKSDIVLQHGSNITVFNAEDFPAAMETAVDGDVIFLGEGSYPGFGITKKITIQGVGQASVITGNVEINIPNEPVLTAPLLQFLKISGEVNVNQETTGLGIKQCAINGIVFYQKTHDAYIDRCIVTHEFMIDKTYSETITINGEGGTFTYPYVKELTVTNSLVYNVVGTYYLTNVTFVNCYIRHHDVFYGNTFGTVINSILANGTHLNNTKLINSYIYGFTLASGSTATNCYNGDKTLDYDSEEIVTNNYLGNDGTIVGPLGGTTPYTLVPDVPQVTVSNFKVDHQKQELNVTLTATPE